VYAALVHNIIFKLLYLEKFGDIL